MNRSDAAVSVPRRGFVVFLPVNETKLTAKELQGSGFSPPKGIRCFSTSGQILLIMLAVVGFSPPKGIRCFSTEVCQGSGAMLI